MNGMRSRVPRATSWAALFVPSTRVLRATTSWAAACLCAATGLAAQQRPAARDTVVSLGTVVVTAERAETTLAASVSSVSRLKASQIARVPHVTAADVLRQLPGFALVSFDGLGYEPQLMVRGFYGGGEAEYVVVLVDGRPVNDLQRGGIAWDALPLADAETIEVVRGGTSPLYGDAALGGVINIITRGATTPATRLSLAGGSWQTLRGDATAHANVAGRSVRISAGGERTDGFRDHAERTVWRGGGEVALLEDARRRLTVSAGGHWREFDEPGPLADDALAADRTASDVFFRFDRTRDRGYRAGADLDLGSGSPTRVTASLSAEQRSTDAVRTIVLAPQFADTKERELRTRRALGTVQLSIDDTPLPFSDRLIIGADASAGDMDARYYNIASGPRAAYQVSGGTRGDLDTEGDGSRTAAALFAHYTLSPFDAVRFSLGARADWLSDRFDAVTPEDAAVDASHSAFSPRAGLNVRYLQRPAAAGHVYINAGRSFKAPTLDQLFDQRRIPVPFPPFAITTSNAALVPQHGTTLEAGVYQSAAVLPGLFGELTLSAYEMKMKDELDFDVATLRYINIGRSRHRGIEAGLRLEGPQRSSAFVNYTLQHVTTEVGEHAGNYIRAIPRTSLSGGLGFAVMNALELGGIATHLRGMYLDDANTIALPAYTRLDARASYGFRGLGVFLDVRNLLDARYNSTGFPDPSGSAVSYYYPAAGRTFEVGVRAGS